MDKQYLNAFINDSPTIREKVKDAITDAAHKVVAFDADGTLVIPEEGAPAVGLLLSDTWADDAGSTPAGTEVDVLIKDIGLGIASAEIKKGDAVTPASDGKLKKAETSNFILGYALSHATADGELVQVQISKSGIANP